MLDRKLRSWIISVITGVWSLNFVVSVIPQLNYRSDQAINAIFMAVVGSLFAVPALQNRKDEKKKELEKRKPEDDVV